jgi:hypothetical protein
VILPRSRSENQPARLGIRFWRRTARINPHGPVDRIMAKVCVQIRLACSVGDSPTGGKVRNLRSLGRIRGGNEVDEADRQSHLRDGERVTGPQCK